MPLWPQREKPPKKRVRERDIYRERKARARHCVRYRVYTNRHTERGRGSRHAQTLNNTHAQTIDRERFIHIRSKKKRESK